MGLSEKKMAPLVIPSLSNTSKFKMGLQDKFLKKQAPSDRTLNESLKLVKSLLRRELGEEVSLV